MALAGRLAMTQGELAARLSEDEFNEWIAWIGHVEPKLRRGDG